MHKMKLQTKTAKVAKIKTTVFVTVGQRGCVVWDGKVDPAVNGGVAPLRDCNGQELPPVFCTFEAGAALLIAWKGKGEGSAFGKAVGAWVSEAGQPVRIYRLADAIQTGAVIELPLGTIDGKAVNERGIFPKGFRADHKLPKYVGTIEAGRGGRLETFVHPDGKARQGGFNAKVTMPETAKATPKAPAKAKKAPATRSTAKAIDDLVKDTLLLRAV